MEEVGGNGKYNTIFNIVKRDITNMEQNIQYSIDCYEM